MTRSCRSAALTLALVTGLAASPVRAGHLQDVQRAAAKKAESAPAADKAAPAAQDAEFKPLIDAYYAAWSSLDASKAAPFYAKDGGEIYYDIAPLEYAGWDAYAAGAKEHFFDQVTSASLAPHDDLRVTRRGKVAWTTETFHLSAAFKTGQQMEMDGRHTTIWEKRGSKWLIVHEHLSVPLQAPAPAG